MPTGSSLPVSKPCKAGAYAGAQVRSTERTGQNLIVDLRELPSKQALGLRSEVAMQARCPGPSFPPRGIYFTYCSAGKRCL